MNVYFDDVTTFNVSLTESALITAVFDAVLDMSVAFAEDDGINCDFNTDDDFTVSFGTAVSAGDYSGPYTVTPSTTTQSLATEGKTLASNIIIEPIPNNYGLIAWNGSVLTVS